MSVTAYCPSCRSYFTVAANPPYAVIHVLETEDEPVKHLHALTREELKAAPMGVQMLNSSYFGHNND